MKVVQWLLFVFIMSVSLFAMFCTLSIAHFNSLPKERQQAIQASDLPIGAYNH